MSEYDYARCSACGTRVPYDEDGSLPPACPKCGDRDGSWEPLA